MLLTTLATCLAALWAMYRDLQQTKAEVRIARDEVQKYRGETGGLDISDPGSGLVLLRSSCFPTSTTQSCDGLMIWIKEWKI